MVDPVVQTYDTMSDDQPGWSLRLVSVVEDAACGAFGMHPDGRRRRVCVTLEYVVYGPAPVELRPETVVLVFTGSSPLQGLERRPALFQASPDMPPLRPSEERGPILVSPGTAHVGTFVYEFPAECREFRLYFGNCEAIPIAIRRD